MSEELTARAFADGLVAEFGTALGSVIGTTVTTVPSTSAEGTGWILPIALSGDLRGAIRVWIGQADSAILAQRVLGMDEPPDEATVADMLREMWAQAAGAMGQKDPFTSVTSTLSALEAGVADPAALAVHGLQIAEGVEVRVSVAGRADAPPAAPVAKPAAQPAAEGASDPNGKLELVLDIDLPLIIRFGRTSMTLKALAELGPGSIVDMGRSPDEPVEMLVGDRVIARGEVVVVGGNYGVRIMDLVSSVERIRALER